MPTGIAEIFIGRNSNGGNAKIERTKGGSKTDRCYQVGHICGRDIWWNIGKPSNLPHLPYGKKDSEKKILCLSDFFSIQTFRTKEPFLDLSLPLPSKFVAKDPTRRAAGGGGGGGGGTVIDASGGGTWLNKRKDEEESARNNSKVGSPSIVGLST